MRVEAKDPPVLTTSESGSAQFITNPDPSIPKTRSENHIRSPSKDTVKEVGSSQATHFHSGSLHMSESEIVKVESSEEFGCSDHADSITKLEERGPESCWLEKAASFHQQPTLVPLLEKKKFEEQSQNRSIVRRKVSLADIIKQAKGYTLKSVWSRSKVIPITKKLEQDTM